jgi:hypothetical protein
MSSSSDIEKLFDHFGGDANAYQEIGREGEARSARTRWPLLVMLDLTQPAIPAIGQRREAKPRPQASDASPAAQSQDPAPNDTASVTRAKAPLFTRSHRRDIPPLAAAAQPAVPRGASRFGVLEVKDGDAAQAAAGAARIDAAAPVAGSAQAQPAPFANPARVAPVAAVPPAAVPLAASVPPVMPVASVPPVSPFRTQAMPTIPPAVPAWPRATAPAAPATWAQAPARAYTGAPSAPAAPARPASILGKLFAPEPDAAPPQPAAPHAESAPLQSVFDRLRGTPAQTAAAPAGAARAAEPAPSNSWLVNGPRRS